MEKTITLPPVIELLASEDVLEIKSPHALRSVLETSGLLDELRQQAVWTIHNLEYADSQEREPSTNFLLTPSGTLNPFSPTGKCSDISCRMAAAEKFAQSVALYADQIVVPDPLTPRFLNEQPLPDWFWERIHVELQVLKYLLPLLKDE